MTNIELDFGETKNSIEFFNAHNEVGFIFERIINLANICFGREVSPNKKLDTIVFGLGHSCRMDFIEIIHLIVNNYSEGAAKILRVFFEKALTVSYLIKHPEKVDNFTKFGHINNYKLWVSAKGAGIDEKEFESLIGLSVQELTDDYKRAMPNFQQTACEKCGTTKKKVSWDIDLVSMAREIGEPFFTLCFPAYSVANLSIHANVMSAYIGHKDNQIRVQKQKESSLLVLSSALMLFIEVIKAQNKYFNLQINEELIQQSETDITNFISKIHQK